MIERNDITDDELELFAEELDDADLQLEPLPGEAAYGTFACFGTAACGGGCASSVGTLSSS